MHTSTWSLLHHCIDIIHRRAAIDETMARDLDADLAPSPSRYQRWCSRIDSADLALDDGLQRELMEDAYNYHAFLFLPLYPAVPEPVVSDIALSGRLYADYLLLVDKIVDGEITGDVLLSSQMQADLLYHRSLDLLYQHFPPNTSFWTAFAARRRQLIHALSAERMLTHNPTHYTYEQFVTIASGKSAMVACSAFALAAFSGEVDLPEALFQALDSIAVAAQLYDDIKDWYADLIAGRPSFLVTQMLMELNLDISTAREIPARDLKRRVYATMALQALLQEAQTRLQATMTAAILAPCVDLRRLLQIYRDGCAALLDHIHTAYRRAHAVGHQGTMRPQEHAVSFLCMEQRTDGAWSDFYTTARESTSWVTGYVGQALSLFQTTHPVLVSAADYLQQQTFPTGGWGYHRGVAPDADSTAACLAFLAPRVSEVEEMHATAALQMFQAPDGGFRTYADSRPIAQIMQVGDSVDFGGWCSSQACVTAAAVLALCATSHPPESIIAAANEYLIRCQRGDGAWQAYWWDGDIYGTAICIRAISRSLPYLNGNTQDAALVALSRGQQFLLHTQGTTGGWSAADGRPECPFQTALALGALAALAHPDDTAARAAATAYLHAHQAPHGGWSATSPIMRLPRPDDYAPWTWPVPVRQGTTIGTCVIDQRQIFTTATVLIALCLDITDAPSEYRLDYSRGIV